MPTSIINIKRGDAPVSGSVIERAKEPHMRGRGYPQEMRDDALLRLMMDPTDTRAQAALAELQAFESDLTETRAINTFNAQLWAWRTAVTRLERYRLADGRPAFSEPIPTGEIDEETGEPILQMVETSPAIDPLPAEIERDIRDNETGEITGTEMIPNPAIVQDDAERVSAQAVVDATPQEVKDFL